MVCQINMDALLDAWQAAPVNVSTGRRVQPPPLVKLLVHAPTAEHRANDVVVRSSSARRAAVFRVHDAMVSAEGIVVTPTLLLTPARVKGATLALLRTAPVPVVRHVPRLLVLNELFAEQLEQWLLDTLPKVTYVTDLLRRHTDMHVLLGSVAELQHMHYLRRLWPFLDPSRLIFEAQLRGGVVRAGVAYLPRHVFARAGGWGDMMPLTGLAVVGPQLHRAVVSARGGVSGVERDVVLYIGLQRGFMKLVENEAALLAAVSSKLRPGLRLEAVASPQQWSVEELADAASRALVLIGPHGGGLLVRVPVVCQSHSCRRGVTWCERSVFTCRCVQNALNMQPDRSSHIVEITGSNYSDVSEEGQRPCFLFLANANSQSFWTANVTVWSGPLSSVVADVDDVLRVLGRIGVLQT
jgi:hypothetical protein